MEMRDGAYWWSCLWQPGSKLDVGPLIISGNNNSNTWALIEWMRPLAARLMIGRWVGELEKEGWTGGGSDGEVEKKKDDDRRWKRKEKNRSIQWGRESKCTEKEKEKTKWGHEVKWKVWKAVAQRVLWREHEREARTIRTFLLSREMNK